MSRRHHTRNTTTMLFSIFLRIHFIKAPRMRSCNDLFALCRSVSKTPLNVADLLVSFPFQRVHLNHAPSPAQRTHWCLDHDLIRQHRGAPGSVPKRSDRWAKTTALRFSRYLVRLPASGTQDHSPADCGVRRSSTSLPPDSQPHGSR